MSPSNQPDRRKIEAALSILRQWKRKLLLDLGHETDPAKRDIIRRRVDEVEHVVFVTERLLHPANEGNES